MRASDIYSGTYISVDDVRTPVVAAISAVVSRTIGKGADAMTKLVLRLAGWDNELVLNKTNALAISESFGDETDNWLGNEIEISFDPAVMYLGKRVGGIRVRPLIKQTPPPQRQGQQSARPSTKNDGSIPF